MSISKRISEAIDKLESLDSESSLISISIAIDATASKVYPNKSNNQAYKTWLNDQLHIITKVGLGTTITDSFRVEYDHPNINAGSDGLCSIEQILYHVIRCGLLHSAELATNIIITADKFIKVESTKLIIPSSLLIGLISAVVVAPVNQNENIDTKYGLKKNSKTKPFQDLWGKEQELINWIEGT